MSLFTLTLLWTLFILVYLQGSIIDVDFKPHMWHSVCIALGTVIYTDIYICAIKDSKHLFYFIYFMSQGGVDYISGDL